MVKVHHHCPIIVIIVILPVITQFHFSEFLQLKNSRGVIKGGKVPPEVYLGVCSGKTR